MVEECLSLTRIFGYMDGIAEPDLIRKNAVQRKSKFWHILRSVTFPTWFVASL